MRRVADTIHASVCPCGARGGADRFHIVDLAHDVRAMREADQFDLPVDQKVLQFGGVQMTGLSVNLPFSDLEPFVGQTAPRAGICLVILIGYNDCIARRQMLPERLRQNVSILRGRGAKGQLVRIDAHHGCQTRTRLVHFVTRQPGCLVRRIRLHFALRIIAGQAVNHGFAGIRPTSVLEKRLPLQAWFRERGKLRTYPIDVQFSHCRLLQSYLGGAYQIRATPDPAGLPASPGASKSRGQPLVKQGQHLAKRRGFSRQGSCTRHTIAHRKSTSLTR